jgi:hypothetical protein
MMEFSSKYYYASEIIDETLNPFYVTVNRLYGNYGSVAVYYEIFIVNYENSIKKITYLNNPMNKMEMKKGILTFSDGTDFKRIRLNVFKENSKNDNNCVFIIKLYNPLGGCYIGEVDKAIIEIYDDLNLINYKAITNVYVSGSSLSNNEYIM